MPAVASSAILRIEYNEFARELHATFTSGNTYTYYGVPKDVYERFLRAASKGQFFNDYIKDRYGR
jgi:KTSC domain